VIGCTGKTLGGWRRIYEPRLGKLVEIFKDENKLRRDKWLDDCLNLIFVGGGRGQKVGRFSTSTRAWIVDLRNDKPFLLEISIRWPWMDGGKRFKGPWSSEVSKGGGGNRGGEGVCREVFCLYHWVRMLKARILNLLLGE